MSNKLNDLKKILELIDDQRRDYNARNFGDADKYTRHIVIAANKFEETYDISPFEFMEQLAKALTD